MVRSRLGDVLGTPAEDIDPQRPFGDLGLDSIFRMDLARALNLEYGTELSAADLYEHDTVELLARLVAGSRTAPPADAAGPEADSTAATGSPQPSAAAEATPEDTSPTALLALLESVLGRRLDPHVAFTDAGLTSFDMLRAISALESRLGALRKTLLFDHPTPAELHAFLAERYGGHAVSSLTPAPASGNGGEAARQPSHGAGTGLSEPRSHTGDAGTPLIVPRRDPGDAETADLLERLLGRYGRETGLAGRDIAPLAFLGAERRGYLIFSRNGDDLLAWSYVGPDGHFAELAGEFVEYATGEGLRPNFLSLLPLTEVGGHRVTATPFGALQRLEDIGRFDLAGSAKSRLRNMVQRFARAGECRTVEYVSGSDPALDARLADLVDAWTRGKEMTNPYVWRVRRELLDGRLGDRHRVFLTTVDDALVNAVVVTRIPAENGYLLDVEFYPPDMPRGGLEFALVRIIEQLASEGAEVFSFGASFGVRLGDPSHADPEAERALRELDEAGIFGSGNFRFKNKFRPVNTPLYLCRPAEGPCTPVADVILMIADPHTAQEHPTTPEDRATTAAPTGRPGPVPAEPS
ncbi:phosphopantetheine-binding protein, partial [Streptomyces sp. 15-116A]|uniref:phosphopantetheine-binding protein n=1 Tax=Streptomyces sp. 15-116A TaxID=2259035 RepID=UPI0021B40527